MKLHHRNRCVRGHVQSCLILFSVQALIGIETSSTSKKQSGTDMLINLATDILSCNAVGESATSQDTPPLKWSLLKPKGYYATTEPTQTIHCASGVHILYVLNDAAGTMTLHTCGALG